MQHRLKRKIGPNTDLSGAGSMVSSRAGLSPSARRCGARRHSRALDEAEGDSHRPVAWWENGNGGILLGQRV